MPTPEQTAATQEMADCLKGSEDQNKAANSAAADTAADLRAGNAAKAAVDAKAAQKAADGAFDQYRAAKLIYQQKKHLFAESGAEQEALESEVLRAYQLALEAQDDADQAKLDEFQAGGAAAAAVGVAKQVLAKRKDARKKFLEAANEEAESEQFEDEASRERKLKATADARQLEQQARDLEGKPPTFEPFKH